MSRNIRCDYILRSRSIERRASCSHASFLRSRLRERPRISRERRRGRRDRGLQRGSRRLRWPGRRRRQRRHESWRRYLGERAEFVGVEHRWQQSPPTAYRLHLGTAVGAGARVPREEVPEPDRAFAHSARVEAVGSPGQFLHVAKRLAEGAGIWQ